MAMQMNRTVDLGSLLQSSVWMDALYSHELVPAEGLEQMPWLRTLQKIFADTSITQSHAFTTILNTLDVQSIPFHECALPFLNYTYDAVSQSLTELDMDTKSQQSILKASLLQTLQSVVQTAGKTLIFELHKSRLSGHLHGETSEARYRYFVEQHLHSKGTILELLSHYPVLARLLCEKTVAIMNAIVQPVTRLMKDAHVLFPASISSIPSITDIAFLGDLHNGGQSVLLFHFQDQASLVYKPHSLAVDQQFQHLLEWFNTKPIPALLRTIDVTNRNEYGWVEFVHHQPCEKVTDVTEFYIRQGQYLALLYILNATDMHYENIIASGKDPVLIDLEALFHNNTLYARTDTATNRALSKLNDSVLRTSLLPISVRNTNDIRLDISGLGSQQAQQMVAYQFAEPFTDQMRIAKSLIPVKMQHNHPLYEQQLFDDAGQFIDEIKQGFTAMYEVIRQHQDLFLSDKGPLATFKHVPIRNIVRETQVYSTMLDASKHPKYLKQAKAREQLFSIMQKGADRFPVLAKVVQSEMMDLLQDDVPYFWSLPNSPVVYDQRTTRITGFYQQDSYTRVTNTVEKLTISDLSEQLQHIEYALSTVRVIHQLTDDNQHQLPPQPLDPHRRHQYGNERYVQEAIQIGEHLLEEAIWGENGQDVTWISLGINPFEQVEYKAMELGIYDGLMGIGIFYAYLANESGQARFEQVAWACLEGVWKEYTDTTYPKASASAFTGYASILYAIHHYYHLFPRTELLDRGRHIVDRIAAQSFQDSMYDFLGGAAGIIPVLLDFYELSGYEASLETAKAYGQRLLEQAIPLHDGLAWLQSNRTHGKPLAGLAHGSSGIAFALYRLYYATGEKSYLQAAQGAVRYDNSLFNEQEQNWTDLRNVEVTNEPLFPVYWCNGAVGVGLSRLFSSDYAVDEILEQDIQTAVHKTIQAGFDKTSHSLCHGNMGNLDFLLSAAIKRTDDSLLHIVYTRMNMMLHELDTKDEDWRCGIPGSKQPTPNLFTGLAGIGYVLLRLHNHSIPSVLILESPAPAKV